jgi:hypothetical protein
MNFYRIRDTCHGVTPYIYILGHARDTVTSGTMYTSRRGQTTARLTMPSRA